MEPNRAHVLHQELATFFSSKETDKYFRLCTVVVSCNYMTWQTQPCKEGAWLWLYLASKIGRKIKKKKNQVSS